MLSHEEFLAKYNAKQIGVYVEYRPALYMLNNGYLPKSYCLANAFWSWVWFLSIPIGVFLLFTHFIYGVLTLFFISFLGFNALKRTACGFILDFMLEDAQFYEQVVSKDFIIIRQLQS